MYYGSQFITSSNTPLKAVKTYRYDPDSTQQIADVSPYGICVTLNLNFPDTTAYIVLYSVDLTFGDSS